jgi:hypothetical protein
MSWQRQLKQRLRGDRRTWAGPDASGFCGYDKPLGGDLSWHHYCQIDLAGEELGRVERDDFQSCRSLLAAIGRFS